ncbi:hypothetical protein DK793_20790 [Escherichia coli]|nr:hypothetical protein [Escherichia coli]
MSFFNDASNGAGLTWFCLIGFTYQVCAHLPKKKFSNLRRCEEGLAGGPGQPGLQGFDPPLPLMITVINYSTSRQDGNNTPGYPFRYWLILAFAISVT